MNKKDKEIIDLVIFHCEMFEFGFSFIDPRPIAQLYNMFAGFHLISTMFLIKDQRDKDSPMGGFCYRVLKPLHLEHLLDPIKKIIDTPLGDTTFGDYIRRSRSKLATHGDLSFNSLPLTERKITFNNREVAKFQDLLAELAKEVRILKNNLEKYLH
ncbi:MAG TPA: hypothetical protein HA232_03070 [Methanocellales archaeon]|nr:hypothetical protein [Methanocellales archaeon]